MINILSDRSVIKIWGEDALKFLQNLTTNDLRTNTYSYNYMLNSQGRYLFDFFVFKDSDHILFIDINVNQAQNLLKRLKIYRLRSKVEFEEMNNLKVIYSRNKISGSIYSFKDPRFHLMGFRSITEEGLDNLSNIYNQDKYNYSIPDGHQDLILEKSVPVEYGANELSAVSYNKGCYVGQELIARTKYYGEIRKKIFKIVAPQDIHLIDKELFVQNDLIGVICSSYKNLAIALIREEKYLKLDSKTVMVNNMECEIFIPEWRI